MGAWHSSFYSDNYVEPVAAKSSSGSRKSSTSSDDGSSSSSSAKPKSTKASASKLPAIVISEGAAASRSPTATAALGEKDRLGLLRGPTNLGRRTSVSAEPISMSASKEPFKPVVHPKSAAARARIAIAVSRNLLFRNLDDESKEAVFDAMLERTVAPGETIIRQGEDGDFFYVVESGTFDIFVSRNKQPAVKVISVGPGGSFGELALMYNAPRAATVTALEPSVVWALDRQTFRRLIVEANAGKRRLYEGFLREVPNLSNLSDQAISALADVVTAMSFNDGEIIIRQGDVGDRFYIVSEGCASVRQSKDSGPELELCRLQRGNYFGEIALLTDRPRAATVSAVGVCKVVCIDRPSFTRLFGTVEDDLRKRIGDYKTYDYVATHGPAPPPQGSASDADASTSLDQ